MSHKILITGASGMLGRKVFESFSSSFGAAGITTLSRSAFTLSQNHVELDLSSQEDLMRFLSNNHFDTLIHCAAFVNLSYCKENPEQAKSLHIEASEILSKNIRRVYYISTDSVFNGQSGNYQEGDETEPLNVYAETKYLGEQAVLNNAKEPFIIRCNIFGFHKPFGQSLFEWGYQNLSAGNEVNGFSNVIFNPLYTGSLSKILIQFHQGKNDFGIYNFGSRVGLSKYDFLRKVAAYFGFSDDLVIPVKLDPISLGERRPLNTTLNTGKLESTGVEVPEIDACFRELKNDFISSI